MSPMATIFTGPEAILFLSGLSSSLKTATVAYANEHGGGNYRSYTPWLCAAPFVRDVEAHHSLLTAGYSTGELVTGEGYLEAVSAFLHGDLAFSFETMPGGPETWRVLTDVESSAPGVAATFDRARARLFYASEFFKALYPVLVEMIVPLDRERSSGFSSHFARGVIFRSFPEGHSSISMAMDLAHEMGHQALMLLQSADPLLTSDPEAPVYSQIRHADRPAIQSLHATAALAYMTLLEDQMKEEKVIETFHDDRILRYGGSLRESLVKALDSLDSACSFSPVGHQLMNEFAVLADAQ